MSLRGRLLPLWQGGLIVLLIFLAYLPALRGGFIWDDDAYVTQNPVLHDGEGLRQIWFKVGAVPQYYPLSFTSFWVDYHLWKLNPLGYHLINLLLHAINAILLWTILRQLRVRGAWLAAAVFAVHPVNVESVAWITERKNVLAGFFYLSSALACLQFWLPNLAADRRTQRGPQTTAAGLGNWKFYWLALLLYLCALLAKTATIALPVAVLLVVWWKRGKVGWRELFPLTPFLAVGLAMGLFTVWVEKHFAHAAGSGWAFSFLERSLIAGRAVWFYLGKLAWPHPLMFVYPRWEIHAAQPLAYLPVLALIVVLFILWLNRKGWARPMLVALAYFLALLFPVLGFFNVYFFRYSFVADHFQYLAGIGPLTLAAAGISRLFGFVKKQEWALCGALVVVLGALTWQQAGIYRDLETLWCDTLAKNPGCWLAQNNLGAIFVDKGRFDEAIENYRKAIQFNPNSAVPLYSLGVALADKGRFDEAIENYRKAIQINPNYFDALNTLGVALADKGRFDEAIENYYKAIQINPNNPKVLNNLGVALADKGRFDEAIENYRKAIQINPNYPKALNNLGNALAARDRFDEAIKYYHQAIQIDPNYLDALNNLGAALAAKGRLDEAIENFRKAIQFNPDSFEALDNLGIALATKGRFDEAIENYRKAIQINPNYSKALNNLGIALAAKDKFDEAIENYYKAIQLNPNNSEALNNLGHALTARGRFDEAIKYYHQAIQLNPNYAEALDNLGIALAARGRFEEAIETFYQAIRVNSNRPETFFHLGMTLVQSGRSREAVVQYREALKLNPNLAGALNNLAWILATSAKAEFRDGTQAVQLAERACELTHEGEPLFLGTLAAAYAEAGRFPEAVAAAEKAVQLATDAGLKKLAEENRQLLELYRAGKPYHEPAPTGQ
jgi:tetratricopeptide (TPR) repeat protein